MPENKIFKNKNSIEERGWEDMLGRLDDAMPVARVSSGREKILILLLLIVIAGMGSYIAHLRSDGFKNIDPPAIEKEYFAQGEKENSIGMENDLSEVYQVEQATDIKNDRSSPLTNSKKTSIAGNTASRTVNTNSYTHQVQNTTEGLVAEYKGNTELDITGRFKSDEALIVSGPFQFISALYKHKNYIEYNGSEVPAMGLDPIYILNTKEAICRYNISAYSGLVSENVNSFGGLEAGVHFLYNLNRKWGLQSGLEFQILNKEGFSNSLALSSIINSGTPSILNAPDKNWAESRYQYDVENSEIVNNEVGVEYITGIVDQLTYLSLPINLVYKYKSVRFFAGPNFSLLLKGTNKIRDYNDTYFNTVILSNKVLENRNYFNRLDVGLDLGLEIKVWRDLQLYGKYNHGLFHVIRSGSGKQNNASFKDVYETIYETNLDQRIDYNRYFSIGIKYNLNNCR